MLSRATPKAVGGEPLCVCQGRSDRLFWEFLAFDKKLHPFTRGGEPGHALEASTNNRGGRTGGKDASVPYRSEATSVAGFIQQLAVAYVARGYRYYVPGVVPEGKDPGAVDLKLIARYGLELSKWARARRKEQGVAGVQLLRHEHFFVLLATEGRHVLFEKERVADLSETPIRYAGYSVSCRFSTVTGRTHASVRIDREEYLKLKSYLVDLAHHRTVEGLVSAFRSLPFEPYAPVRRQLLNLLRAVNRERERAGFESVPMRALRLRRRVVRPFERDDELGSAEAA